MKTLTEAVKACGGVWPSGPREDMWIIKGTIGVEAIQLFNFGPFYTRPEFEAESARQSGKPSWDKAPEWAQWLAQCDDGHWEWYEKKPIPHHVYWSHCPFKGELAFKGTVLGDWRDTLERRPEVEAKRQTKLPQIVYDHTPDNADDGSASNPADEMPVGWHGEVTYGTRECWRTCVILPDGFAAVELDDRWVISKVDNWEFRPLKSNRERWVEAARDKGFKAGPAGRMYDALLSGELPMPEKD